MSLDAPRPPRKRHKPTPPPADPATFATAAELIDWLAAGEALGPNEHGRRVEALSADTGTRGLALAILRQSPRWPDGDDLTADQTARLAAWCAWPQTYGLALDPAWQPTAADLAAGRALGIDTMLEQLVARYVDRLQVTPVAPPLAILLAMADAGVSEYEIKLDPAIRPHAAAFNRLVDTLERLCPGQPLGVALRAARRKIADAPGMTLTTAEALPLPEVADRLDAARRPTLGAQDQLIIDLKRSGKTLEAICSIVNTDPRVGTAGWPRLGRTSTVQSRLEKWRARGVDV